MPLPNGARKGRIARLVADPAQPVVAYLLTLTQRPGEPAVFTTTDGGATWTEVATPPAPASGFWGSFGTLGIDPKQRLLMLTNGSRFFSRPL